MWVIPVNGHGPMVNLLRVFIIDEEIQNCMIKFTSAAGITMSWSYEDKSDCEKDYKRIISIAQQLKAVQA